VVACSCTPTLLSSAFAQSTLQQRGLAATLLQAAASLSVLPFTLSLKKQLHPGSGCNVSGAGGYLWPRGLRLPMRVVFNFFKLIY